MSRSNVPSCPRAWPRVAVLALIGVTAAACSDSARFVQHYDPFATAQSKSEVTGSVAARPASSGRVAAQPLPAPSKPQTVAATTHAGVANGASGLGAYRPGRSGDVTGSVPPQPQSTGHWSRDGGTAITVARGQTVNAIARQYNVPAAAIVEANQLANPNAVEPGQRLVVPRYVAGNAQAAGSGNVHVVKPGETLISIARRNGMSLSALARANSIDPYTRLNVGDRITVPAGGRQFAARAAPAPKAAPQPAPVETVASVPAQTANVAKPEVHEDKPASKAEPAGSIPTFRWPVRGRIIAGFGAKANGTQNDGINLAVPEGTPVKAADDGVVAYAGNELKGYGNLVLVRHPNGYVSAYANASELLVKRGDNVKRGQVIARAGQTGNVTSPQLHFEIRKGSTPVDPTKYLSGV
jgi:murein DD-endopeptidase MepM/ murein hydrolase activator NlpD